MLYGYWAERRAGESGLRLPKCKMVPLPWFQWSIATHMPHPNYDHPHLLVLAGVSHPQWLVRMGCAKEMTPPGDNITCYYWFNETILCSLSGIWQLEPISMMPYNNLDLDFYEKEQILFSISYCLSPLDKNAYAILIKTTNERCPKS
jgi:hypothetical protein